MVYINKNRWYIFLIFLYIKEKGWKKRVYLIESSRYRVIKKITDCIFFKCLLFFFIIYILFLNVVERVTRGFKNEEIYCLLLLGLSTGAELLNTLYIISSRLLIFQPLFYFIYIFSFYFVSTSLCCSRVTLLVLFIFLYFLFQLHYLFLY